MAVSLFVSVRVQRFIGFLYFGLQTVSPSPLVPQIKQTSIVYCKVYWPVTVDRKITSKESNASEWGCEPDETAKLADATIISFVQENIVFGITIGPRSKPERMGVS